MSEIKAVGKRELYIELKSKSCGAASVYNEKVDGLDEDAICVVNEDYVTQLEQKCAEYENLLLETARWCEEENDRHGWEYKIKEVLERWGK